jgi:hypothetical protein
MSPTSSVLRSSMSIRSAPLPESRQKRSDTLARTRWLATPASIVIGLTTAYAMVYALAALVWVWR